MNLLKFTRNTIIFIGLALSTISAFADGSNIVISDLWAREAISPNGHSAAYFEIKNNANLDDELLSAETAFSSETQIHNTTMKDGNYSMVELSSLAIPANSVVIFKPKSLHIMFMGLNQNLKAGDKFELVLHFKNAGKVTVTGEVRKS